MTTLLSRAMQMLGLYSDADLAAFEAAPTEPCGPPDPDSAPAVDAVLDGSDEWIVFGGGK